MMGTYLEDTDLLFSTHDIHNVFIYQKGKTKKAIDIFGSNQLLNVPIEKLVECFYEEYKFESIHLFSDQITVDQSEIKIDISQDPSRYITIRSRPFFVPGSRVKYFIPFEGDDILFQCRPSTYSLNPPRGIIEKNQIILIFDVEHPDAEQIKSQFDNEFGQIKSHIECLLQDTTNFNKELKTQITNQLSNRKERVLQDQGMVAALGFPLKKRAGVNQTFNVPLKRKILPVFSPETKKPFAPEPTLEMNSYEDILHILSNMVTNIERSPDPFTKMSEEELRNIFLIQLNSIYEGKTTGETFNYSGKTDILIRENSKNIFIAECKFWKGESSLLETINQLLGYISWRDTKTAILIFNKNKDFSKVVNVIPEIVRKHECYVRNAEIQDETSSRYIFHNMNDKDRELILTIMCFDIPKE